MFFCCCGPGSLIDVPFDLNASVLSLPVSLPGHDLMQPKLSHGTLPIGAFQL